MKNVCFMVALLTSFLCIGQKKKSTTLGKTTLEELKLRVYERDSSAAAVVLFEHGNYYIDPAKEFNFTTDYYVRIKILKKSGFDKATVKIPLYGKEEVLNIKAITYNLSGENGMIKNHLLKSKIYTNSLNKQEKEVSFALSNIKVGSVLEYTFTVSSPYSQIDDWNFQSDIPKMRSNFTAAILGNWQYNISVVGYQQLDRDNPSIKKRCVYVPGAGDGACRILEYGMDFIPAFKEEDYMLSKRNFLSRITFDLKTYTSSRGVITNYTKTWKSADKKLKNNFLDNQLSKKQFFKKKVLTQEIISTPSELEKAKKIYALIQNHFTWNGQYWPSRNVKIKRAFEAKKGNVFDINLSLFNALKGADIACNLTLLATRDKGRPTRLYPIDTDFNYVVVRVEIDGKVYFLDAVNPYLPFGLIQFEGLNGEGRVMDFENGSYWEPIKLRKPSHKKVWLSLELSDTAIEGKLVVRKSGYMAVNSRIELKGKSEEDILNDFESENPSIEVGDFELKNLSNTEKKLEESYQVTIDTDAGVNSVTRLYPFMIDKTNVNPFKLNERKYPIDFGYPRSYTYMVSVKIPENYRITKIPENMGLALPDKGGKLILNVSKKDNLLNFYLKFSIHKTSYSASEYFHLKQFFQRLIDVQNTFVKVEKK